MSVICIGPIRAAGLADTSVQIVVLTGLGCVRVVYKASECSRPLRYTCAGQLGRIRLHVAEYLVSIDNCQYFVHFHRLIMFQSKNVSVRGGGVISGAFSGGFPVDGGSGAGVVTVAGGYG